MKKTTLTLILTLCLTTAAFAGKIPDTGQTKCYDNEKEIPCPKPGEPFYGQDANYSTNPQSYTKIDAQGNDLPDSAAEWAMVRDNVTGLIWEVKTDDGSLHDKDNKYTWQDAQDVFIAQVNAEKFGGFSDWRLPTPKELASIIDNHSINDIFLNTQSSAYWTSTEFMFNRSYAWVVNFLNGIVYNGNKIDSDYVRCVRSGADWSFGNLAINGDDTVTDKSSGLTWQQKTVSESMNWENALSYCENLTLGGQSDWRLPNVNELQSLADYTKDRPATDTTFFPDTRSNAYWSSTTITYDNNYISAWAVNFNVGSVDGYYGKTNMFFFRCVRGGQSEPSDNIPISTTSLPDPNSPNNPTTTPISLYFTGTVNHSSVEQAFYIQPHVPGTFQWDIHNNMDILTFTPSAPLDYASTYTFGLSQEAAGANNETVIMTPTTFFTEPQTSQNQPPTAHLALSFPNAESLFPGIPATLSAVSSINPDGDPLTYQWRLTTPEDSISEIIPLGDSGMAMFTPDLSDTYTVTLTANDGELQDTKTLSITIKDNPIQEIQEQVPADQKYVEIAGLKIYYDGSKTDTANGYSLSGNVSIEKLIYFSGSVEIIPAVPAIKGDGEIYIATRTIPKTEYFMVEKVRLHKGAFQYSLADFCLRNIGFSLGGLSVAGNICSVTENGIFRGIALEDALLKLPVGTGYDIRVDLSFEYKDEKLEIAVNAETDDLEIRLDAAGKFALKVTAFGYESENSRYRLAGEITLKGVGIEGEGAVANGKLDSLYASYSNSAAPIPFVQPVNIYKIGGGFYNLATDQDTFIRGTVGFIVGKDVGGFFTAKGELNADIYANAVKGEGTVWVVSDKGKIGYAEITVDGKGVELMGEINVIDAIIANAELKIDYTGQLWGMCKGTIQAPEKWKFIGGKKLGSVGLGFSNEDIVFGVSKGPFKIGGRYIFRENDFEFPTNTENLEKYGLRIKPSRLYRSKDRTLYRAEQALHLTKAYGAVIIRIAWETSGTTDFNLIAPDGSTLSFSNLPEGYFYEKNTKEAYYIIPNPATGNWTPELVNPSGVTSIGAELMALNEPPEIKAFSYTNLEDSQNLQGFQNLEGLYYTNLEGFQNLQGLKGLSWNITDAEGDPLDVSLVLTDDLNARSALTISQGLAQTAQNQSFDLGNMPSGEYFLCITAKDEFNPAQIQCATEKFAVRNANAPDAPENLRVTPSNNGVIVSWDSVENAIGYRVHFAEAGKSNINEYVSVGNVTFAEIKELKNGHTYTFAASAVNENGVESLTSKPVSLAIRQTNLNNAPMIHTHVFPESIPAEQQFSLAIQASDMDSDTLTYSLTESPNGMIIDSETGVINWYPFHFQTGGHKVAVKVEDSKGGEDLKSFYVNVFSLKDLEGFAHSYQPGLQGLTPPAFVSTPVTQAVAGKVYSYGIKTQDADNDTVTLQLVSKPSGMVLKDLEGFENGSTELAEVLQGLEWTPSNSDIGKQTVVIAASDNNNTVYQAFDLFVSATDIVKEVESFEKSIPSFETGQIITVTGMSSALNNIGLNFSKYALMKPLELSVSKISDLPKQVPDTMRFLGKIINLEPTGTLFQAPVQITIPFGDITLPAGVSPSSVKIVRFSPFKDKWELLKNQTNNANVKTVVAEITHFSTYALVSAEAVKGDLNGDMSVTLEDAILGLQVCTYIKITDIISDFTLSEIDVNKDNKIGLEEAVYILQKISEIR